jgi:nicotinamidase-related amidase
MKKAEVKEIVMTKSVLLVADMINDLVNTDGGTAYKSELIRTGAVENMAKAIARARAASVPVVYIRVGFSEDYRECPVQSPIFQGAKTARLFQLGTWGTEIHPLLEPKDGDFDVVKHRVSPFYGTTLLPVLGALGAHRLVVGGVSTGGVVLSAAKDGHDRDYQMMILDDCCCAGSEAEHQALIASMQRYAGITTSASVDFDG